MDRPKLISLVSIVIILIVFGTYASWYSYERQVKIAKAEECINQRGGPGKVLQLCNTIIPPSIWDLARGRIIVEGLPERMALAPYSLEDVLLGNYKATLNVKMLTGCDQSATTTDCSKLPPPQQSGSQPYIPPNTVEPDYTFTSATDTPITVAGYSFMLPSGWKVEAYRWQYQSGWNIRFQKDGTIFAMECPPSGKGFEMATITEKEERAFVREDIEYKLIFESLSQSIGNPWYFLFIQAAQKGGEFHTECLASSGSITPDITEAMQMFYDTLDIK